MLIVKNLTVSLSKKGNLLPVVKNLSYTLNDGEFLTIVGESGCGKTLHALALMGLLPDTAKITNGQVIIDGQNILSLSPKNRRDICGKVISLIFQEPLTALNPVLTIKAHLMEVLTLRNKLSKENALLEAQNLLKQVEIDASKLNAYPHQLSGGQRQRVMIALALAQNPKILIADEPTTALDSNTQEQILTLLKNLQIKRKMGLIFITHNLAIAQKYSDKILVLYAGKKVEEAPKKQFFDKPLHPYSQGLLNSLITENTNKNQPLFEIQGKPPKVGDFFAGCPFESRCNKKQERCKTESPILTEIDTNHFCACFIVSKGGK